MGKEASTATYVLVVLGAGLLSFAKPPLQYLGVIFLALGCLFPLTSRIVAEVWMTPEKKEQRIMRLLQVGLVRGEYVVPGGKPVAYYIDMDLVTGAKDALRDLANLYTERIRRMERQLGRIDKLAFPEKASGPVGALALMGLIEERTDIPSFAVRLRRRLPRAVFKGASPEENDTVVIVSDVVASGRLIIDMAKRIRSAGAEVPHALVLCHTNEEARRALEDAGINLESVADPELLAKLLEKKDNKRAS